MYKIPLCFMELLRIILVKFKGRRSVSPRLHWNQIKSHRISSSAFSVFLLVSGPWGSQHINKIFVTEQSRALLEALCPVGQNRPLQSQRVAEGAWRSCLLWALLCLCCPSLCSALHLSCPGSPLHPASSSVLKSYSPCAGASWELFGRVFMSLSVSCPCGARADVVSLMQPCFQAFCIVSCSCPVFFYQLFFQLLTIFSSPVLSHSPALRYCNLYSLPSKP